MFGLTADVVEKGVCTDRFCVTGCVNECVVQTTCTKLVDVGKLLVQLQLLRVVIERLVGCACKMLLVGVKAC